jgi:hypothetical protein
VPSPAEVVAGIIGFVGDVLGASSLRFEIVPTIIVLGVLLAFLQLVARPVTRWVTGDAGGLAGLGRAMAVAAEAGTDAVISLGSAGLVRSTDAHARLQTLAALPILGHVARAAARSGVRLRVLTNDPLAAAAASATLDAAHVATATPERARRSRVVMVGEGRLAPAGLVLTAAARPAAAVAAGSLREEATLHLEGLRDRAASLVAVSAEVAQAPSLIAATAGALVGAEAYQAPADLRADAAERTTVLAANRLIALAAVAVVVGSLLALGGFLDPHDLLLGIGGA